MADLVEAMRPVIDRTIEALSAKRFTPDPIAGKHFSKIVSLMSSAYKRHGYILENAILRRLAECPKFEVWEDKTFYVTEVADHMINGSFADPSRIIGTTTQYRIDGHRTLQMDAIVYDKESKTIRAYEVKRGSGLHDAGKRRQILRDLMCSEVLLRSYGEQRNLEIAKSASHIIFYYGQCSIRKPFSLVREELDDHFGWPIVAEVEAVNQLFQKRLFEILST